MKKSATYLKTQARLRRVKAIRKKIFGTTERPRLVVFKSNVNIYAQIIDDTVGKTLVSMSTIAKDFERTEGAKKTELGFQVGLKLGEKALQAGITKVSFDRAGNLYQGRIKALAEGARKAGLEF